MPLGLSEHVYAVLQKQRRGGGLQPDRLRPTLNGWTPISTHIFFKTLANQLDTTTEEAFVSYARVVANALEPVTRLIVDYVFVLRLEENRSYRSNLTDRWGDLFREWLDLMPSARDGYRSGISESTFRQQDGEQAQGVFAEAIDQPNAKHLKALGLDHQPLSDLLSITSPNPSLPRSHKVTVFGAAVMDIIFRIPRVPEPDGSEQATAFELRPGGKGLCQAVACARLGMKPMLIAAIANDVFGSEILDYLNSEGVDTSLIKTVPGEKTPVAAVITPDTKRSFAIGWKNESHVSIGVPDLRNSERAQAIRRSRQLLVTFEPPIESIEAAMELAHDAGVSTILTPAPPLQGIVLNPRVRPMVEYLVCNEWELSRLLKEQRVTETIGEGQPSERDRDAEQLLLGGVKHVLATFDGQCSAYSREEMPELRRFAVPAWFSNTHDSAGERDAFCAMLALKLVEAGRFNKKVVYWATAAMAYSGHQWGVADSMPRYEEVADIIAHGPIAVPEDD